MIAHTIRATAVTIQIIGVMWALIATIYCTDYAGLGSDLKLSAAVIAAGFGAWLAVGAWEAMR